MSTSAGRPTGPGWRVESWRILVGLVSVTVLILGLYRQVAPQPYQAPDFSHTYRASQALRDGSDLYAPALSWVETYQLGQPLTNQYFYAPTYALLLTPLTFLPYQAAIAVWGGCLLVFLCVAVYALFRSTGPPPSLVLVLVVAAAASLMSAVRAEYFLGQANLFMLACICTAIWARQAERPGLAGIFLALALVTKPMLLLISAYLLWKREFKFALTTIAGFLVLLLTPFLWLGRNVLANLLTLWHFYSTQYLSFSENIAPRGMLERLFTVNPFVRPLVDMPVLAVALWLVISGMIFIITLAVIAPRPFRRESRSLIELGVMLSGLLLVSPLTEPPYLVLLIMPLVGTLIYLRGVQWNQPPFRWAALALGGLWGLELIPRKYTEDVIARLPHADPFQAALFVILVPTHFYILLATFGLQLHLLHLASGSTTRDALDRFVRNSPMLVGDWLTDLLAARTVSRDGR
jgi:Glycosyltransferase family 87